MAQFRVVSSVAGERFAFEPGQIVSVPADLDAAAAAAWCQSGILVPEAASSVEVATGAGARRRRG